MNHADREKFGRAAYNLHRLGAGIKGGADAVGVDWEKLTEQEREKWRVKGAQRVRP